jgi:hypothetical protein
MCRQWIGRLSSKAAEKTEFVKFAECKDDSLFVSWNTGPSDLGQVAGYGCRCLTHEHEGIRLRRINLLQANDLRNLRAGEGAYPSDQKRDR